MKPVTLALVVVGVAGAGAGGYFLLRRRRDASKDGARDLGAAQAVLGAKAVQMGVPAFVKDTMGGRGVTVQAPVAPQKGSAPSPSYVNQALGLAGGVADLMYPGVGSKAASILQAVDSKVGSLVDKVPGVSQAKKAVSSVVSKLKFW